MGDKAQLIICARPRRVPRKRLRWRQHGRGSEPRRRGSKQTVYARYDEQRSPCSSPSSRAFRAGCFRRCPRRGRCQYAIGSNKSRVNCSISLLDPSSLSPVPNCLRSLLPFSNSGAFAFMALESMKLHAVLADILEQAAKDGCLPSTIRRWRLSNSLLLCGANSTFIACTIRVSGPREPRSNGRSTRASIASWPDMARRRRYLFKHL